MISLGFFDVETASLYDVRRQNRQKLSRFLHKCGHSGFLVQSGLDDYLKPKQGFIRFLDDNSNLRYKFCLRTRPAGRTVIGRNRRSRTQQLIPQGSCFNCLWNASEKLDDPQRKPLRSRSQFLGRGCHCTQVVSQQYLVFQLFLQFWQS